MLVSFLAWVAEKTQLLMLHPQFTLEVDGIERVKAVAGTEIAVAELGMPYLVVAAGVQALVRTQTPRGQKPIRPAGARDGGTLGVSVHEEADHALAPAALMERQRRDHGADIDARRAFGLQHDVILPLGRAGPPEVRVEAAHVGGHLAAERVVDLIKEVVSGAPASRSPR